MRARIWTLAVALGSLVLVASAAPVGAQEPGPMVGWKAVRFTEPVNVLDRIALGSLVLVASATPVGAQEPGSVVERKAVQFTEPIKVVDRILLGRYIIVHDKVKEARGEPCTWIYEWDGKQLGKLVLAFNCDLVVGEPPAERFTVLGYRTFAIGTGRAYTMTAFRFAGSTEAHYVPR